MIKAATEDAQKRAEVLLGVTGNSPGNLIKARVGVFQITPFIQTKSLIMASTTHLHYKKKLRQWLVVILK